jgi:predicted site-specific integrase-resolvase
MDNFISASEAARRLKVPQPTMSRWLREGRIPGAMKIANMWVVPVTLELDDIDMPKMGRPVKEEAN